MPKHLADAKAKANLEILNQYWFLLSIRDVKKQQQLDNDMPDIMKKAKK
jgi:hypothetical protein